MSQSYTVEAILSAVDRGFTSTLATAESQLKTFSSFSQSGSERLEQLSNSMISTGKLATAALTAPLVAGATKSIGVYRNFDDSMRRVAATAGITASSTNKDFVEMSNKAKELGASTQFSASQVADGMNYMAMAGWNTTKTLSGIEPVLKLAIASGEDLATTSDIVTDAMTAFGIEVDKEGKSVTAFSDILAAASSSANTNVSLLGETFKYVAPVAGALGFSVQDTAIAIGMMANNSIKGSQAGTALRTGLTNLANPTDQMKEAMDRYGISLTDSAGNMKSLREVMTDLRTNLTGLAKDEQAAAVASIFGKNAMSGWLAIINGSDEDFNKLTAAIDNSKGATDAMVATIDGGIGGTFEGFKSAAEGVGIAIGERLEPFVVSVTQKATELMRAFTQLSPEMQDNIIKWGALAAAIGPALIVTGTVGKGLASVWGTAGKAAGSMGDLALKTKGAISGLGTWGSNLAKGVSDVATTAMPSLGKLKGGFETVAIQGMYAFDKVKSVGSGTASALWMFFEDMFPNVAGVFTKIGSFGQQALGKLGTVFGNSFNLMAGVLKTFSGIAMNALMPAAIFGAFLAGLGLLNSQFGEQIQQMADVAVEKGPTLITNLINGIASKIPDLITQGTQLIEQFTRVIVANAPALIQGAVAMVQALVSGVGSNASSLIGSAIQIIGVLVDGLLSALPQLLATGMQFLVQLAQGVVSNLPLLLTTAQTIFTNFVNSITQNLPTIIQSGIQIILSLVEGIIANLPQIAQTAVTMVSSLLEGLASALPQIAVAGIQLVVQLVMAIISGLPTILEAGGQLILGLGQAMLDAIPNALAGVWDGIKNGFTSAFDWITGKSSESNSKVKADIDSTATDVATKTAELATSATTNFDLMKLGVTTATGETATQSNFDFQSILDSVTTNFGTANQTATAEAQGMADSVNAATGQLNLDVLNDTLSMANSVGTNFGTANAQATSQASQMASGVNAQVSQMEATASQSMSGINQTISSQMSNASQSASKGASDIANSFKTSFEQAKQTVNSNMQGIATNMTSQLNKISSTAQSSGQKLAQTFKTSFNQASQATKSAMSNMQASMQSGMSRAVSIASSSGQRIVSIFYSLSGQMASAGAYAGAGFANGLAGQAGRIYAIASSIANNVAATIRRALDIHSPSRVTRSLGGYTGEGMYLGLKDWQGKIGKMAELLAIAAIPDMDQVDLSANLRAMTTSAVMDSDVTVTHKQQPMEVSLSMGGTVYRVFTSDITKAQEMELILSEY